MRCELPRGRGCSAANFRALSGIDPKVRLPQLSLCSCHSSDTFDPNFMSLVNRGEKPMETWQAFVLGVMVAYTPSIVFLAFLLRSEDQPKRT